MRYELKSIPIWPLTRVAFFVHLVVGFLTGLFYAAMLMPFVGVIMSVPEFDIDGFGIAAAPLGTLMMLMPFLVALSGAFFGTLFTVVVATVYNLMAKLVGGMELNFTAVPEPSAVPVAPVAAATQARSRQDVTPPPPQERPATPPPPPPVGGQQPPPSSTAPDQDTPQSGRELDDQDRPAE